jgi:hypothetical protein
MMKNNVIIQLCFMINLKGEPEINKDPDFSERMWRLGDLQMLSFEQKKSIFKSFQELQEKSISYNRMNYIYPDSVQRGKVLATQLQPSGNGYVIGKYMDEETIRTKGYVVDDRGWINIREFSSGDLQEIITTAMISMSGNEPKDHSHALHAEPDRDGTMMKTEKQETPSQSTIEGGNGLYLSNLLGSGMIHAPMIWFEKSGAEISKMHTKTVQQSFEFVQSVTNIWMSAMFGKSDKKDE